MKLNLNEQIDIFIQENSTYIFIYAIYAAIITGISLLLESRSRQPEQGLGGIIIFHGTLWVSSILLMAINMFITGWRSRLFGGEFTTFVIIALLSLGLLYSLRRVFLHLIEAVPHPSIYTGLLPAVFLLLPFLAFNLFVFASAAGFRN